MAIALNRNKRRGSRKDFPRGKMDLGDFRICLSVLGRELQFEVEIENWNSYMHRKVS